MTDKKKPMKERDAAFSMKVGGTADGAIFEIITVADSLYLVAERAVHQVRMADQIDPDRAHPETPHTSQRVAPAGAESPIVRRSFLQAATLFKANLLADGAPVDAAILATFDFMQHALAAERIHGDLVEAMKEAEADLPTGSRAVHLPSIADARSAFCTKLSVLARASEAVLGLLKAFHGSEIGKGHFDAARMMLQAKYGAESPFGHFAESYSKLGKLIRNLRNATEHAKPGQRLDVKDYRFEAGELHRPTVEVVHPETPVSPMPLERFMAEILEFLLDACESMIVHLAEAHVEAFGGFELHVLERTEEQRDSSRVRFGFYTQVNDHLVPFG